MSSGYLRYIGRMMITVVILFVAGKSHAQVVEPTVGLRRYAGNVHQFNAIFPQEKVYLQFDNTAYFSGETIWFKAFVVQATNLSRAESGVLYVDLLSPSGVLLQQQKLKIRSGQADGYFVLVDNSTEQARAMRGVLPYPSGYYEVRAYTQFMMNFSQDAVFSRVFPVYEKPGKNGDYEHRVLTQGSWTEKNRPETPKLKDVKVSFYPEGGQLVPDAECRMAFKAIGRDGRNLDGVLQIQTSDGVISAPVEHDGMGSISFVPDKALSSALFTSDGKNEKVSLPRAIQAFMILVLRLELQA